jgi:hypothetical protein
MQEIFRHFTCRGSRLPDGHHGRKITPETSLSGLSWALFLVDFEKKSVGQGWQLPVILLLCLVLFCFDRAARAHSGRNTHFGKQPPLHEKPHRDHNQQGQQIIHFHPPLFSSLLSRVHAAHFNSGDTLPDSYEGGNTKLCKPVPGNGEERRFIP